MHQALFQMLRVYQRKNQTSLSWEEHTFQIMGEKINKKLRERPKMMAPQEDAELTPSHKHTEIYTYIIKKFLLGDN